MCKKNNNNTFIPTINWKRKTVFFFRLCIHFNAITMCVENKSNFKRQEHAYDNLKIKSFEMWQFELVTKKLLVLKTLKRDWPKHKLKIKTIIICKIAQWMTCIHELYIYLQMTSKIFFFVSIPEFNYIKAIFKCEQSSVCVFILIIFWEWHCLLRENIFE